jgi:maleamate amidohydrolase
MENGRPISKKRCMARIWDEFLTPQDKLASTTRGDRRFGFGERPALLMIDLYRWVFGDRPQPILEAIRDWPSTCGLAGWEAVPHIQRLLGAARAAGIPVIYSKDTDLDGSAVIGWAKSARGEAPSAPSPLSPAMADRRRRMNDIIDEVAPLPGELVITKAAPSVFWGTPLLGQLTARRIDTIIVTGESTSGCVRSAVVDGCTNRFNMIVAEECVFDRTQASHAINLFDMNQKYADVLPVDEIIEYLARRTARVPA